MKNASKKSSRNKFNLDVDIVNFEIPVNTLFYGNLCISVKPDMQVGFHIGVGDGASYPGSVNAHTKARMTAFCSILASRFEEVCLMPDTALLASPDVPEDVKEELKKAIADLNSQ